MSQKKITYSIAHILLLCCWTSVTVAQEVISTQGDSYSSESIQFDFTFGELVIDSYVFPDFAITQGFHQSYAVEIPTKVENQVAREEILIYPNPASDYLKITTKNYQGLTYRLHDLSGKLISHAQLKENTTMLNISDLSDGAFRISIADAKDTPTRTYLIIKRK